MFHLLRMRQVFFLRGLSTKGGDTIRFAFKNWGYMYTHIVRDLEPHGLQVHPVIGMGGGPLEEQASRALAQIRQHPVWLHSNEKIHLLGHSAGGLIARKLVTQMTPTEVQRVASILTIATPHRGSRLAEICLTAADEHPWLAAFFRWIGFDVRTRIPAFLEISPPMVESAFRNWAAPAHIRLASVVCGAEKKLWSWPFHVAHLLPPVKRLQVLSDGLLEAESQTFGEVLDHFQLDHLCQLGVYQKPEFHRMCEAMAQFYERFEPPEKTFPRPL